MTLEQLQQHVLFRGLTSQQKQFVLTYCTSGGNKIEATKASYNVTTDKSVNAIASKVLKKPEIKMLLDSFFGNSTDLKPLDKSELLGLMSFRLREPKLSTQSFIVLSKMYVSVQGWTSKAIADEVETVETDEQEDIHKLVQQMEQQ